MSMAKTLAIDLEAYESIQGCWISPHTPRRCRRQSTSFTLRFRRL